MKTTKPNVFKPRRQVVGEVWLAFQAQGRSAIRDLDLTYNDRYTDEQVSVT
jgi:hypothetical protein